MQSWAGDFPSFPERVRAHVPGCVFDFNGGHDAGIGAE
jgi:hypothetical protein